MFLGVIDQNLEFTNRVVYTIQISILAVPGCNESKVFFELREYWCSFRLKLVEVFNLHIGRQSHELLDVLIFQRVIYVGHLHDFFQDSKYLVAFSILGIGVKIESILVNPLQKSV